MRQMADRAESRRLARAHKQAVPTAPAAPATADRGDNVVLVHIVHHPHLEGSAVRHREEPSQGGESVLLIREYPRNITTVVREAADDCLADPDNATAAAVERVVHSTPLGIAVVFKTEALAASFRREARRGVPLGRLWNLGNRELHLATMVTGVASGHDQWYVTIDNVVDDDYFTEGAVGDILGPLLYRKGVEMLHWRPALSRQLAIDGAEYRRDTSSLRLVVRSLDDGADPTEKIRDSERGADENLPADYRLGRTIRLPTDGGRRKVRLRFYVDKGPETGRALSEKRAVLPGRGPDIPMKCGGISPKYSI